MREKSKKLSEYRNAVFVVIKRQLQNICWLERSNGKSEYLKQHRRGLTILASNQVRTSFQLVQYQFPATLHITIHHSIDYTTIQLVIQLTIQYFIILFLWKYYPTSNCLVIYGRYRRSTTIITMKVNLTKIFKDRSNIFSS